MYAQIASTRFASTTATRRPTPPARPARGEEADALLAAASEDDLELALRLVAWNPRDLGQFLKARAPR